MCNIMISCGKATKFHKSQEGTNDGEVCSLEQGIRNERVYRIETIKKNKHSIAALQECRVVKIGIVVT